jgi:hypothetical protein
MSCLKISKICTYLSSSKSTWNTRICLKKYKIQLIENWKCSKIYNLNWPKFFFLLNRPKLKAQLTPFLRPFTMVVETCVEWVLKPLESCVESGSWWCGGVRSWKNSTVLKPDGRNACRILNRCFWRVHYTPRQGASPSRDAERICAGQVAARDWSSRFLSHFIFKLNYFIAN